MSSCKEGIRHAHFTQAPHHSTTMTLANTTNTDRFALKKKKAVKVQEILEE